MTVFSLVSGGATSTSVTIGAKVDAATSCRVAYSTSATLAGRSYSAPVTSDANGYLTVPLTGLAPAGVYYYGVEVAGVLDATIARTKTLPTAGQPASFTVVHGSCAQTDSTHRVFDAIRTADPLMFIHQGDMHYLNIAVADAAVYRDGWNRTLTADRQKQLWQSVPSMVMWDDHDFGPNNSNATNTPGRTQAGDTYRQVMPHYPLPASDGSVYQAFDIGRVRFIVTDLRYNRSPDLATDDATKTMLGAEQKAWFKAQLLAAKDRPLTVWINTQIWHVPTPLTGASDPDGDNWGGFSTERAELNNYMATNGIRNVVQLSGDMHALGFKRRTDFSTARTAPMGVYVSSPFDQTVGQRADNNWDAAAQLRGNYATLTITDNGGSSLAAEWKGYNVDATTGAATLVMSDKFGTQPGRHAAKINGVRYSVKVWDSASSTWVRRPVKSQ